MGHLVCLVVLAGPWVQSPVFPQAQQETVLGATVRVSSPIGYGTAVRVWANKENGKCYYLTAAHVVGDAKEADLESYDPATEKFAALGKARVRDVWPAKDLAVLEGGEKIPGPVLRICPPENVPAKAPLTVLGAGFAAPSPVIWLDEAKSRVAVNRVDERIKIICWQVGQKSEEGRSGGPLVAPDGHLVGICSGNKGETGYYVHIDEIHECLKGHWTPLYLEKKPTEGQNLKKTGN